MTTHLQFIRIPRTLILAIPLQCDSFDEITCGVGMSLDRQLPCILATYHAENMQWENRVRPPWIDVSILR